MSKVEPSLAKGDISANSSTFKVCPLYLSYIMEFAIETYLSNNILSNAGMTLLDA